MRRGVRAKFPMSHGGPHTTASPSNVKDWAANFAAAALMAGWRTDQSKSWPVKGALLCPPGAPGGDRRRG